MQEPDNDVEGREREFRVQARAPVVIMTRASSPRGAVESVAGRALSSFSWPEDATLEGCGLVEVYDSGMPSLETVHDERAERTKSQILARRLQFELLRTVNEMDPSVHSELSALSTVVALTLVHNEIEIAPFIGAVQHAMAAHAAREAAEALASRTSEPS